MLRRMNTEGTCGYRSGASFLRAWVCGAGLLATTTAFLAAAQTAKAGEVFKLREVSVFEQADNDFLRGQSASCQDQPFTEVKAYPAFMSQKPVYGSVRFAAEYGQTNAGELFYFAVDESQGAGKGYDKLYFDHNRDLDLRNDAAVTPQKRPPASGRLSYNNIKQQVLFDFLSINFDLGAAGTRPVQIMPRLTVTAYEKEEYNQVTFVRTSFYEGNIELGGQPYSARLGNDYLIQGRLDVPNTALVLSPADSGNRIRWWGGDRLMAVHKVGGMLFTISATPTGEELTVQPYQGELGTFEIGPGGRKLDPLTVVGSLAAKDLTVAVGDWMAGGSSKGERRCQIPVGDYLPSYITVQFGRLQIAVSQNYHSDGKPRDRAGFRPCMGSRSERTRLSRWISRLNLM